MENYDNMNDEALQGLAAGGDRQAGEHLIMRFTRLVRICARPYFLAGGDSEDLTQEGMLGLLSAIREYDGAQDTSFKTFAELCINRRLITAIRTASRLKHSPLNNGISLDSILLDDEPMITAYHDNAFRRIPEEHVLARESADEIIHTYSRCLSKFETEICNLYLSGLTYREISENTGRPVKSVDNAVQRIRRKLAQLPNLGDISDG